MLNLAPIPGKDLKFVIDQKCPDPTNHARLSLQQEDTHSGPENLKMSRPKKTCQIK